MWAVLSGIEGNIAAYEAVLADLNRQRVEVEALYILGDIVAANPDSEKVIRRIQNPLPGELEPQVCVGWWEEQCFALHGLGSTAEPTELIDRFLNGASAPKSLKGTLHPSGAVSLMEETPQTFGQIVVRRLAGISPRTTLYRFGKETAKLLWDSVSRETVQ